MRCSTPVRGLGQRRSRCAGNGSQRRAVEIPSVRTSFSQINSAVSKGLFAVYSDFPEDPNRGGSDALATSCMPLGGSVRKSRARGDLPPAEPRPQPSDRRDPNSLIIRISIVFTRTGPKTGWRAAASYQSVENKGPRQTEPPRMPLETVKLGLQSPDEIAYRILSKRPPEQC